MDRGTVLVFNKEIVIGRGCNKTTVYEGIFMNLRKDIALACVIKRVMKQYSDIENEITQEPYIWSKLCQNSPDGIVRLYGFVEDDDFM